MDRHESKGWGDVPNAGDLAALMKCEGEYVHSRRVGTVLIGRRAQASREGQAQHAAGEASMLRHHNGNRAVPAPSGAARSGTDGRCFIASSVYGPDAAQTDELRVFRDRALLPHPSGRALVRAYYAVSPSVARWLSSHARPASAARSALDWLRSTHWVREAVQARPDA